MMGKIAYFAILTALVASYAATFGQELNTVEAVCALNQKTPKVLETFKAPFGAQHDKETIWRKTAPSDFHAVLALMQVVTVAPCEGQKGEIAIRAIRLIERDPATGKEAVVSEVTDFSKGNGGTVFDGALFQRIPSWYQGTPSTPNKKMLQTDGKELVIDMSQAPRLIYHGWTEPKVTAKPGMNYLVEMEAKISGLARLQMGIDYWREITSAYNTFDSTCQKSNNCEGYLSKWYGVTDGFQAIRVPSGLMK
jgi:hypothetical protein